MKTILKYFPPPLTVSSWLTSGSLLRSHRIPIVDPDLGVVTSVALDSDYLVAGLANSRIHVFSARTGVLVRTLVGHETGVWAVNLVRRGGGWVRDKSRGEEGGEETERGEGFGRGRERRGRDASTSHSNSSSHNQHAHPIRHDRHPAGHSIIDPQGLDSLLSPALRAAVGLDAPKKYVERGRERGEERKKEDDVCGASEGWGQEGALVVSGGCDKMVRVWDVGTGYVLSCSLPIVYSLC